MKPKLTVFQRLVRAAKRGTGMRLSEHDVFLLGGCFDHIRHIAAMDDEAMDKAPAYDPSAPTDKVGT